MAKQVVNDFSKGSIISNILRLSIPMTLAQLINVLYSIVDRIYIGRMGENSSLALTGVGVCLPIITIVIAFANLIGMGGAPLFSIKRGEGNEKDSIDEFKMGAGKRIEVTRQQRDAACNIRFVSYGCRINRKKTAFVSFGCK